MLEGISLSKAKCRISNLHHILSSYLEYKVIYKSLSTCNLTAIQLHNVLEIPLNVILSLCQSLLQQLFDPTSMTVLTPTATSVSMAPVVSWFWRRPLHVCKFNFLSCGAENTRISLSLSLHSRHYFNIQWIIVLLCLYGKLLFDSHEFVTCPCWCAATT